VGQLVDPQSQAEKRFAVVPYTKLTKRLAERMAERASILGIGIALVNGTGEVHYV